MGDRLIRWFYGIPNMVGIVLALVGLGLYIGGAISGFLVPLIVIGLYLLGAIVTPKPKGIGGLKTLDGDVDPGQIKSALNRIVAESQKRLPERARGQGRRDPGDDPRHPPEARPLDDRPAGPVRARANRVGLSAPDP